MSTDKKLKGMPIKSMCEYAWEAVPAILAKNTNLVAIPDIETGWPQIMTIEQRERLNEAWEMTKPKMEGFSGKLLIFGTGGEISSKDTFYEMWNKL